MQTEQTARFEAHQARPFRFDPGANRFQAHEQPLPVVGDAGRIGWYQHQPRTARERLAESHARMDAERFGGERNLADLMGSWLGRKSDWSLKQLSPIARGDTELEAGEQDTDDHERMFAEACDSGNGAP